jgi:hypothetical protein
MAAQLSAVGALTAAEEEACGYALAGGHRLPVPWLEKALTKLWADNGDALSLQYAGTQARCPSPPRPRRRLSLPDPAPPRPPAGEGEGLLLPTISGKRALLTRLCE